MYNVYIYVYIYVYLLIFTELRLQVIPYIIHSVFKASIMCRFEKVSTSVSFSWITCVHLSAYPSVPLPLLRTVEGGLVKPTTCKTTRALKLTRFCQIARFKIRICTNENKIHTVYMYISRSPPLSRLP